ncbi:sporulation integral membrane protein YtvI [Ornithinibacillus salinisoli]|uniref:Sporulation integral membrane protein YtvI n=1 Tax=Ornithinibacillus salinisoli TaxID=1848459 RepID=A0ABW4W5H5_9BACI
MYKQFSFQILRSFIVIGILVASYFLFVYTFSYTYPFIIAIALSLLINPLVTALVEKAKFHRTIATIAVILFIFTVIIGVLLIIVSEIIQGTLYLAEITPTYFQTFITIVESFVYDKILPLYDQITSYFNSLHPTQQATITDKVQQFLEYITTTGTTLLQGFFLNFPTIILLVPNSFTIIIFILLATFFITKDWYDLKDNVKQFIPSRAYEFYKEFMDHLKRAFAGYIKAQALLIFISTCIIFIGLLILQVEHALTITFFAALFDILPFIGTGIIFIPWIIYSFVTTNYMMTISLCILFGVIIVARQILEPKILSSSIGVNPLFGLFILFITIQVWGVIGILIAPALMILFYVLFQSGTFTKVWQFIKG